MLTAEITYLARKENLPRFQVQMIIKTVKYKMVPITYFCSAYFRPDLRDSFVPLEN